MYGTAIEALTGEIVSKKAQYDHACAQLRKLHEEVEQREKTIADWGREIREMRAGLDKLVDEQKVAVMGGAGQNLPT